MLGWLDAGCRATGALGDDDALHELASRMERQARHQGALAALAGALVYSGVAAIFAGAVLDEAQARFTEREAIEAARGADCRLGNLIVAAWRGHENETRAGADAGAAAARSQGQGWRLTWVEYARCVLELSLGRYQEAMAAAPHAFEENRLVSAFAWADYVEAAVRCGDGDAAGEVLARFTGRVGAGSPPMALGLLARSRALLARDQEAEGLTPKPSTGWPRARARRTWPGPISCTANGCACASAAPRPGDHLRAASAQFEADGLGGLRRAGPAGTGRYRGERPQAKPEARNHPTPRKPRSRRWPPAARPTRRSRQDCS